MKPEVLLMQRIADPGMRLLDENFQVIHLWANQDTYAALAEYADTALGVLTGANRGLSSSQMERLRKLEIVSLHGVGLDRTDLSCAKRRGIRVAYTPDVLTADVADMGLGLMLSVLRRIPQGHQFVVEGHWEQGKQPALGRSLTGKRLGILGLGRIGSAIAKRAEAFGMSIAYTNRTPRDDVTYRFEPDIRCLAQWCDVLMVAASASQEMRPPVSDEVLHRLGPEGIVVNVGRGTLIDEGALITRLQQGRLLGAGLDVFANGSHVPDTLRVLDNVVLSSHQATATIETRNTMAVQAVNHLIQHFSGHCPMHLATPK